MNDFPLKLVLTKSLNVAILILVLISVQQTKVAGQRRTEVSMNDEHSRIEVKANPLALLFGGLMVEGEYLAWDYSGLATDIGIGGDGLAGMSFYINFRHKYYFRVKNGWDRFHFISQLSLSDFDGASGVGYGFGGGYKIASTQNVLFEFNFSISRIISSDEQFFPLANLLLGYRF